MNTYTLSSRSVSVMCVLLMFSLTSAVDAEEAKNKTFFSAPDSQSDPDNALSDETAYLLGSFEIPLSKGRITFVDEAPYSASPEISVVVIEDAEFNTLAQAMKSGISLSDLYLAYAPKKASLPERLSIADEKWTGWPGAVNRLPKSISSMRFNGPAEPDVDADDWAAGCVNLEAWESEFSSWVASFDFPSPATNSQTTEVDIPHATQGYGYFGYMDNIWAGVCMRSGETMHVGIQFKNHNGIWVSVGGWSSSLTKADLSPGQRYLYHSFKPFTGQRRVYVSATGDAPGGGGNWAIISNAWRDDFKPDSTYAHP